MQKGILFVSCLWSALYGPCIWHSNSYKEKRTVFCSGKTVVKQYLSGLKCVSDIHVHIVSVIHRKDLVLEYRLVAEGTRSLIQNPVGESLLL